MGNSSNWYNYWSRGRPWIKSGWEDGRAGVLENEMKRGWIVLLAALSIALGAILWEFGRARSIEWIAFAASSAVILYAGFAVFDYTLGPGFNNCVHAREAPLTSERGVRAEAMARYCTFFGVPNEKRLSLHRSDDSGDSVLVTYEPRNNRDSPVCIGSTTIT